MDTTELDLDDLVDRHLGIAVLVFFSLGFLFGYSIGFIAIEILLRLGI